MVDHFARLWLKDLFDQVPSARSEFERITGINPDEAPTSLLKGGIEVTIENETLSRQQEREDKIREEGQEFQARLEQAKLEALRICLSEAASIIGQGNKEDAERLEKLLITAQQGYQELQSSGRGPAQLGQGNYLPALVSYTNCWRKHDSTTEHPEGRPGPSQCIQTMPQQDGVHYRCLVACSSQSPSGFARLKYQVFHAELLKQGDCPRPESRSISRRIPGVSWLLTRSDICPLADGGEYLLTQGEIKRVSD